MAADPDDLAALQGVWEQTAFEENGVLNPPDEYGASGSLTTKAGHHFTVRSAAGVLLLEGDFEIDPASRAINWIDSIGPDTGKKLPALYKLEDNVFTFIAADEGAPRPTEFRTVPGMTMRSFRRCR